MGFEIPDSHSIQSRGLVDQMNGIMFPYLIVFFFPLLSHYSLTVGISSLYLPLFIRESIQGKAAEGLLRYLGQRSHPYTIWGKGAPAISLLCKDGDRSV